MDEVIPESFAPGACGRKTLGVAWAACRPLLKCDPVATFRAIRRSARSVVPPLLEAAGETHFVELVAIALSANRADRAAFLASNELWGGAGSMADQAGCENDRATRRKIEAALIKLGEAQLREGITNVRTDSWVQAFRRWQWDSI
jgi:hypothetical protein